MVEKLKLQLQPKIWHPRNNLSTKWLIGKKSWCFPALARHFILFWKKSCTHRWCASSDDSLPSLHNEDNVGKRLKVEHLNSWVKYVFLRVRTPGKKMKTKSAYLVLCLGGGWSFSYSAYLVGWGPGNLESCGLNHLVTSLSWDLIDGLNMCLLKKMAAGCIFNFHLLSIFWNVAWLCHLHKHQVLSLSLDMVDPEDPS